MKTLLIISALSNLLLCTSASAQRILKEQEINSIQSETILCENEIFVWTKSNVGLLRHNKLNGKTWSITRANSILPSNNVTGVVMCGDGQTYIATTKGMAMWDNYGMLLLDTENTKLPENHITSLWLDDHENLYIQTKNLGTYKGTGCPIKAYKLKKVADRVDSAIKCDLFQRNSQSLAVVGVRLQQPAQFLCSSSHYTYLQCTPTGCWSRTPTTANNSLTFLKEDKRFVWAKSDLGVVRINKHSYKTWLVSPKIIALPSPIVTGIVYDICGTFVSTSKGIVYDNGSCTLTFSTDNTDLPENNIVEMKMGNGGLLIKTKHYGWYVATGSPVNLYKMKKADANLVKKYNLDITAP